MEFSHAQYPIARILDWVRTGKVGLPDFQRELVWSPRRVVDLMVSVARGWPIGALLVLEAPQDFRARPIESAPRLSSPEHFLLDGQQRVTSLFHALCDVSDIVYYADLRALLDERPEWIRWSERAAFERAHPDARARAAAGVALLREVFDEQAFLEWRWTAHGEFAEFATTLRETHFPGFVSRDYTVPAIVLPASIEPHELGRIFETTNRPGTRLDAFDLLVPILAPLDFNLRLKWESARDAEPALVEFDVEGIEIVKLIALWERQRQRAVLGKPDMRGIGQSDLLRIPPRAIADNWGFALHWYLKAIAFLREKLGVLGPQNLPAVPMVLTLAHLLRACADAGGDTRPVERWFWKSIQSQRYAYSGDAQVVADVDALGEDNALDAVVPAGATLEQIVPAMLGPVRRNRILMRGTANALVVAEAVDPFSMKFLKDSKDLAAVPVRKLRKGTHASSDKIAIADLIFMDPASAQELAVQVSRGKPLESLLDGEFLAQQGFDEVQPFAGNYIYARAALLSGLLIDLADR